MSILMTAETAIEDVEEQLNLVQRYLRSMPETLLSLGIRALMALVLFVIGTRVIALIRSFIKKALTRSGASREAEQFLDSAVKALLYVILIFMILQLFGVEAASIATVIGSVGVTVGLAIQGSLTNCIGGILILTLKPFKVGDYIVEDTHKNEGTVQQISIFYTKLTTFDNKVVLIPNGTLANSSMTNVTDEAVRRIDIKVSISYRADIRQARAVVERLAAENPMVAKDRELLVFVDELADSGVVLGVRFWAKKEVYWAARYRMLEDIKYGFDEAGVEIPYPQLDVHLVEPGGMDAGGARDGE